MPFSWYIARRYLFSKNSKNAINYITGVSVTLVAVVSMALIIAMSVFNGLALFIMSLFNVFDPDIRITHKNGGVFIPDSAFVHITSIPEVASYSEILIEDVLLSYTDKQLIAKIKGVSKNYAETIAVDSILISGNFAIHDDVIPYVTVGQGIAHDLSIGLYFRDALHIYAAKRKSTSALNPLDDFNKKYAYPCGVFSVQQEIDNTYILSSLAFARELLEYNNNEVSAIEIALQAGSNEKAVMKKISQLIGDDYLVQNKDLQHAFLYKITQSEKLITFLIVSLILVIASFSIVGAITMLIIEKQRDIQILKSMGADVPTIKKIFVLEGWIISLLGACIGIVVGLGITYIQQTYGIITLSTTSNAFAVDAYPVQIQLMDTLYVLAMVVSVGFIAAYYPVQFVSKKYLQ
ncbi:MAG: ABC transporter permease [Bacteroidales bacterium]|jgi:lipoprotein-releasing system permease protein|nr:ABC transporter permease [Bacteroidales bacterium]HPY82541.1 FtsX-like permease family protein [Bacteroidales bacterium]